MNSITRKTWFIYILFAISYFFSYFFRVSTSVVMPILQKDWGLSASVVGFISSMYFYTYAILQPISGILNDKYEPNKIVGIGIVITAIGSCIFGIGTSITALIVGRLFMGIGLSPMLSGLLVFQSRAFAESKYAFYSGLSMMIGNFGAVISVAPLSYALDIWGREIVFTGLSIITFCVAIALFLLSKKDTHRQKDTETFKSMFKKRLLLAFEVIKQSKELRIIILSWLIIFGGLMAFQGLWAVSWFYLVYPENHTVTNIAATMVSIGVMLGNILGGNICRDPLKRNIVIKHLTISNFLIWIILISCFSLKLPIAVSMLFSTLLGISNGMVFVQFTTGVNEISPIGQGGTIFGLANFCIFASVIFYQWGTGMSIEQFSRITSLNNSFLFTFIIVAALSIVPIFATSKMAKIIRIDNGANFIYPAQYSPLEK